MLADLFYRVVVRAFSVVLALLRLRIDVRDADRVPSHGPAVLVGNHVGYLDFALAGVPARRSGRLVRFMAKISVFESPVAGPLMRAMGHVPVHRVQGAGAYRTARRLLERGEVVGIFPEATISRAWTLKPFKPGPAALALETGAPLVPVIQWGGHRVVTVGGRRSLRPGTAVTIQVGEHVKPEADDDVASLTARLHAEMAALLDEVQRAYPQQPRDDADRWWQPAHLGGSAPTPQEGALLDAEALRRHAARRAARG